MTYQPQQSEDLTLKPTNQKGTLQMNVKPMNGLVFVAPKPHESMSASGIYLGNQPDNAEKVYTGTVRFVADSVTSVKVGDEVLYSKYSPQTTKVEGEHLLVIKDEDLLSVVETE